MPWNGVPVLKWQRGGCYSSWCETGWYSSPALVDVNGDGRDDVIASAYSLWALDGTTGAHDLVGARTRRAHLAGDRGGRYRQGWS